MSSLHGFVADTVSFSCVDGPGNRFVVFLQGCNFNCVACHNPQTIACPIDGASKARLRTIESLLTQIGQAAPFLSGITVSGGEATQQASFVGALFTAINHDAGLQRLTCFVDTNGAADERTWDDLLPVMDGAMVDLKCLDPQIHYRLTGQPNDQVLQSIRYLQRAGRLYEVRLLLVPGVNDNPALLHRTAAWLAAVDPAMRVKLIGFRCHGVRPMMPELNEASAADMQAAAAVFAGIGRFAVTVV